MVDQLAKYACALGIFIAAVIARLLIDFVVPGELPFITFFPAVFLAGYYFGHGPGVLVLALSTLVGTLWVAPFGYHPASIYWASAFLFLVVGGLILFLVDPL